MVPHAPRIIEILVPYWSRAEEEPLFQSALVVTFTKIAGVCCQILHVKLATVTHFSMYTDSAGTIDKFAAAILAYHPVRCGPQQCKS